MPKFKKTLAFLSLVVLLAASAQAGKFSLKFQVGGTYLMGGDYNKNMDGWRNYELSVIDPSETFVDNLKKIGLGFQLGGELLYELSPSFSAGIEIGYLKASVESWFSRTWHNYKMTLNPAFSAVPILLNVHYFYALGGALRLHASAGAGVFLTHIVYGYAFEDTATPYHGTWTAKDKIVFGAKAGIGVEYGIASNLVLTFDIIGRLAQGQGYTGEYSGEFDGSPYSGAATAYYFDRDGQYPNIVFYSSPPVENATHQNVRDAKFSFSGLAALFGVKITL